MPYKNLPMIMAGKLWIRVIPAPTQAIMFANKMHFFLPYLVKGPMPIAPSADPAEHIEVIIDEYFSIYNYNTIF